MGRVAATKQLTVVSRTQHPKISKWCNVCQTLVDLYHFQSHLHSQKHLRKVARKIQSQIQRSDICKKGIRIEEPPSHLGWEAIIHYFQQFGKVIALVKLSCDCVLLQFENIAAAKLVLQSYHHVIPVSVPSNTIQPLWTISNYQVMQVVLVAVHPREMDDPHIYPGGNIPGPPPFPPSFHIEKKMREYFSYPPNSSLNAQLCDLVSKFKPSDHLKTLKNKVMWDISSWLFIEYPRHVLHMFGSSVMGLDIAYDSDIDFYLKCKPDECGKSSRETRIKLLNRVGYILSAHPDVSDLEVISTARVPIIKFLHLPTGIMCDINCENDIGVKRSQFIAAIQTLDARIPQYFFALKLWAKAHYLLGNPMAALSSYGLVLLALFHLQRTTPSVVPPIASFQFQVPADQRVTCDGWNLSYKLPAVNCSQTSSAFRLVKSFFEFYRSFDSKDVVICPLLGDCLSSERFLSNPPSLDENMFKPYLDHIHNGGHPLKIKQLTVQDPFELNNNVTYLYTRYDAFQSCCNESFRICCALETFEGRNPVGIADLFTPFPS